MKVWIDEDTYHEILKRRGALWCEAVPMALDGMPGRMIELDDQDVQRLAEVHADPLHAIRELLGMPPLIH